jgi:hypothetical protein
MPWTLAGSTTGPDFTAACATSRPATAGNGRAETGDHHDKRLSAPGFGRGPGAFFFRCWGISDLRRRLPRRSVLGIVGGHAGQDESQRYKLISTGSAAPLRGLVRQFSPRD